MVLYHAHASSFDGMAPTGPIEAINRQLAANECQDFLDQSDLSAGQLVLSVVAYSVVPLIDRLVIS